MKKWSKKKQLIFNLVILILLAAGAFWELVRADGIYPDANTAYAASEATRHYGPSEVHQVIEDGNKRWYAGIYDDKWYSLSCVEREWNGWRFGNGYGGYVIDTAQALNYQWIIQNGRIMIFGVACNTDIVSVKVRVICPDDKTVKTLEQKELSGEMFVLYDMALNDKLLRFVDISAYDANGERVYYDCEQYFLDLADSET